MRSKRVISATVLLVLIGAAGYYWTTENENTVPKGSLGLADSPIDSADQEVRSLSSEEKTTSTSLGAIRPSFAEVKIRAERGDPLAQRELYEIYDECFAYSLSPQNIDAQVERLATQIPRYEPELERIRNHLASFCQTVDGGKPITVEAFNFWLEKSAENGDLAAQLELASRTATQKTTTEAQAFVQRLSDTKNPAAVFAMGEYLSSGVNGESPEEEFSALITTPNVGYAWKIAACRSGYDCGRGSAMMNNACIISGDCGHLNLESMILDQAIPPGQRKNIEVLISLIQSKFLK